VLLWLSGVKSRNGTVEHSKVRFKYFKISNIRSYSKLNIVKGGEKVMSVFIKDWEDLNNIPKESKTHILEIDMRMGCAWLRTKDPKPLNHKLSMMRQIKHQDVYLSTHTFYGKSYKHYEKLLHACGFDVTLANWDAED
jgi:hypothetical protein